MHVTKVHGCGNDFVVIADLDGAIDVGPGLVRGLCDRHRGIGGDGVIRLAPPRDDGSDVFMDYRNADGGVVEMCGNGVRCVATYVLNRGLLSGDVVRVGSRAGVKHVVVTGRDDDGRVVETLVDMGAPVAIGHVMLRVPRPDGADVATVRATTVSMGNPHAVVRVEDVAAAPVATLGPRVEVHDRFPKRTNVGFVQVVERDHVRLRVWERGVGETAACGSGACAAGAALERLGLTDRAMAVDVPGGRLEVALRDDGHVLLTGPAVEIVTGTLDEAWLRAATAR